jgi:hypothetical protein
MVIKSRKMRWAKHEARIREMRITFFNSWFTALSRRTVLPENLMGRDNLGDLVVDGRILLRILKKQDMNWLRVGSSGRLL